jgi:hypothetical protein
MYDHDNQISICMWLVGYLYWHRVLFGKLTGWSYLKDVDGCWSMGCEQIHGDQDVNQWWGLVNIVMRLWVAEETENTWAGECLLGFQEGLCSMQLCDSSFSKLLAFDSWMNLQADLWIRFEDQLATSFYVPQSSEYTCHKDADQCQFFSRAVFATCWLPARSTVMPSKLRQYSPPKLQWTLLNHTVSHPSSWNSS